MNKYFSSLKSEIRKPVNYTFLKPSASMRFPRDIVKLITSYLPSKQLLPLLESIPSELLAVEAQKWKHCFWGNPNVFEAGIFSEAELPNAPKHLIARNPACANYILSNWGTFKDLRAVWRNPALWESLQHQPKRYRDLEQLAKNPNPEAIRFVKGIGFAMNPTNPGIVFDNDDFVFLEEKIISTRQCSTWANPSAVPFLQQIVANEGKPHYAWLRENSHPWAVQVFLKYLFEDSSLHKFKFLHFLKSCFKMKEFLNRWISASCNYCF